MTGEADQDGVGVLVGVPDGDGVPDGVGDQASASMSDLAGGGATRCQCAESD
jgi:hypothetical protein